MGRSLRARITRAATASVALVLIIGGVLAIALMRSSLLSTVEQLAAADATTISSRFSEGPVELTPDEQEADDRFVQVISDGEVVAASDEIDDSAPLATGEGVTTIIIDRESYVAVTEEDDGVLVVAGRSTEEAEQVLSTLVPFVVGAIPVLVLLLGVTTWLVVGRALTPVDRMRREVDAVTADSLDRRVAQPANDDELGRLAATMNRMLARLDESQRSQQRFISDASHELRSPLASLRQYAEVARDYPDRITKAELVAAIADEGGRLETIVRGMLVLARADEAGAGGPRQEVDLDDILLAEAARLRAAGTVVDSSGVEAVRVLGDEGMLGQVLRNLSDNAARHADTRVVFAAAPSSGHAVITVDDDGEGIPAADRERVFERFVRLDEGRSRDAGGSGLGLAIVREIVAAHGGTVVATESPLGGARLVVTLPAAS